MGCFGRNATGGATATASARRTPLAHSRHTTRVHHSRHTTRATPLACAVLLYKYMQEIEDRCMDEDAAKGEPWSEKQWLLQMNCYMKELWSGTQVDGSLWNDEEEWCLGGYEWWSGDLDTVRIEPSDNAVRASER